MRLGRSLFGGVTLIVSAHAGTGPVIVALVAAIWFSLVLVLFADERSSAPHPDTQNRRGRSAPRPIREVFRGLGSTLLEAFRAKNIWLGLVFALLAGAGFEAVGAVAGSFLIDRDLAQAEVGVFLALPVVPAMLIGGLIGGALSDRNRRVAVMVFLVLMAGAIVGLSAVAGGQRTAILALLGVVYFGIGLFVAASYALFMDPTNPRLGATQFSTFMAATNGCESWAGFVVGRLIPSLGYAGAFITMAVISLLALPAVFAMRTPDRSPSM